VGHLDDAAPDSARPRLHASDLAQSVPIRFSHTKLYLVVKLGRLATVSGVYTTAAFGSKPTFTDDRERRLGARSSNSTDID